MRHATAPASCSASISSRFADAVSATTATLGHASFSARVASMPSRPGQAVVHQRDVRVVLAARRHGLFAVGDGRDDEQVAPQSEQKLERLAEDRVVLDDDDPDPLVRRHDA